MSGTSVISQSNAAVFNHGRNLAPSLGELEHTLHGRGIPLDIIEFKRHFVSGIVLTGLGRVGSRTFSENQYFLLHMASLSWIT